jgi:hypothetical protein
MAYRSFWRFWQARHPPRYAAFLRPASPTFRHSSQLHALAYTLANVLRTVATPGEIETWSLTSLRERLVKTGARLVRHARYAVFQMAAAALPQAIFTGILDRINGLRDPPAEAACA